MTWVPNPGIRHASILGALIQQYDLRANSIRDAQLAALAFEPGLTIYSADTDFVPGDLPLAGTAPWVLQSARGLPFSLFMALGVETC